ncbi:GNAT family N-acetyltransferase [Alginatibacterium sediminis]|uniref:GNAT family N-acetyltransferase n=1 Tax=Alginatibacterium sediminis TaxID=2164068 RepID=A0A420ENS3_9ALTE|nr:GNAT family N-acetyltransferase [Alginatibacterium sediminis]RKF22313.1 GNAT family N-acetyltransferase [Alginatibacterium sediminis]
MITIREMAIEDYAEVMLLWSEAEGLSLKDADSPENIAHYLKRNPGLSFVALNESEVIAAVLVGTDGRRAYLQHLAVSKEYRRRNIASELLRHTIQALAQIGISKTHLFVHVDNVKAQHFYEKLGWFARDEVRMYSFNSTSNPQV